MPALSAAEIPASPTASFLATSSGILPAAMPPAARQSSNPGHVGLEGERLSTHPHVRRRARRLVGNVPDHEDTIRRTAEEARRGPLDRQLRRREERGAYRELLVPPPLQYRHGSLGAEGVEDPRHRNRALSHAGARLGPQRHGLVAHREHLWVSPPCIRRLLQYAAHDGATDDKTTRSIGRCRGIVVGADHVEKCSCC
jgi:hypothetical protein